MDAAGEVPHEKRPQKDRIGLLLVHGIGDQARFEHLNVVAGRLIRAAIEVYGKDNVSVQQPGIYYKSDMSIVINDTASKKSQILELREMWWRDLGQEMTPLNVVKFWFWAATFAGTRGRIFKETSITLPPKNKATANDRVSLGDRWILFFKITYFFILLFPLRIVVLLVNVLPGIRHINLFRTIFNYMSSVQMYQQRPNIRGGALSDFDQSRRLSIQRRFANAAVGMAREDFTRWYIMGHSLGSVVAFKGLMYPDEAWARFVTYDTWHDQHFPYGAENHDNVEYPDRPKCPSWLDPRHSIETSKLLENCAGLITWGSPLETFARTWPGMVHLRKKSNLTAKFEWINFYDRIDVIASKLRSFDCAECGPSPLNFACKSSLSIFSAHTSYLHLRQKEQCISTALLIWMLAGNKDFGQISEQRGLFHRRLSKDIVRLTIAGLQWAVVLAFGLVIWPISVALFLQGLLFLPGKILEYLRDTKITYWSGAYNAWAEWTIERINSLRPRFELQHDLTSFAIIIASVLSIVLVGGLIHNMHDLYLAKVSERKRKATGKSAV